MRLKDSFMKALVAMKVIGTAGSFSPAGQWVDS